MVKYLSYVKMIDFNIISTSFVRGVSRRLQAANMIFIKCGGNIIFDVKIQISGIFSASYGESFYLASLITFSAPFHSVFGDSIFRTYLYRHIHNLDFKLTFQDLILDIFKYLYIRMSRFFNIFKFLYIRMSRFFNQDLLTGAIDQNIIQRFKNIFLCLTLNPFIQYVREKLKSC